MEGWKKSSKGRKIRWEGDVMASVMQWNFQGVMKGSKQVNNKYLFSISNTRNAVCHLMADWFFIQQVIGL